MKGSVALIALLLIAGCGSKDGGSSPDAGAGDTGSGSGSAGDADSDGDSESGEDTATASASDSDTASSLPECPDEMPFNWSTLPGGTYLMGSDILETSDERPAHDVTITSFEMLGHEVTIAQYIECVQEGACTPPSTSDELDTSEGCNWLVEGRCDHPVNCVDVYQAGDFCSWIGARLPSESEWEYAARGAGQDITYPWGEAEPTCERAVMYETQEGCGENRTWPVCSKPAGNTEQGLCDMAGNVWEWLPDWFRWNYEGAPTDGSVWDDPTNATSRVIRGGSYASIHQGMRTRIRGYYVPFGREPETGFRCARDPASGGVVRGCSGWLGLSARVVDDPVR